MTDNNHPITPPPELVEQWYEAINNSSTSWKQELATHAARWGADQELEACCEWLKGHKIGDDLRRRRRPKPPSLKEQAIALLESIETSQDACSSWDFSVVRRALESLPE